jgi:hypothetical protein
VTRRIVSLLALGFALAHLPYLPSTLEDIDSVNFALGVRDFDVAEHRPHPPGYPVYVGLGKLAVLMTAPFQDAAPRSAIEARALAILSLIGATAAVVLVYRLTAALATGREVAVMPVAQVTPDYRALTAVVIAAACPLFWYAAVRPMSDAPGLAAALAAQACLALAWRRQQPDASGDRRLPPELMAASGRMIVLGSLLTAIAAGFRSQNAVLTVPFLLVVLADRIGRGVAGALIGSSLALIVGTALWAVPLIAASGGPDAYLAALGSQAGEDFAGVDMLYLDPGNVRLAAFGLLRTFVFPWDSLWLGGAVVVLAGIGGVALLIRERRALVAIVMLAVPYLIFHLLFQDTTFTRYALPLVPPVAFLAASGAEMVTGRGALAIAAAIAVWALAIALPVTSAYGRQPSPTARVVREINGAVAAEKPGALAMHQTFRRPLEAEDVLVAPVLASPPRREWLELVRYWRDGGRIEPVWFLADPRRTDLALIDPRSRQDQRPFTWDFASLSQLGGMRPAAVTWYRMSAPGWFAEEGWALTPETAGIARLMGRGPHIGPITAWVRRRPESARALIGGRHLGSPSDAALRFVLAIDGREIAHWEARPGFFVQEVELPPAALLGEGALARLTIQAEAVAGAASPAAVEQFDLQNRGTLMWAFDEGWHEAEYHPDLGVWRWTSNRSILRLVDAATPVTVTFRIESPRRYYGADATVRLSAGDRAIAETTVADDRLWSVTVPLDALRAANGRIALETDRTFVPAATGDARDQRMLGLRIFDVHVRAQP